MKDAVAGPLIDSLSGKVQREFVREEFTMKSLVR